MTSTNYADREAEMNTATEKQIAESVADIAEKLWMTEEDLREMMLAFTKPEGQCLLWTGQTDGKGYGVLKRNQGGVRHRVAAHRMSYAMSVGPIYNNLSIMHLCDNKLCVNPHHLVMGTQKANMYDLRRKGGASHGVKHTRAKLSEEQVMEVRKLAKHGYLHRDLAAQFGVSRSTISKVVSRTGYGRVA